MELARQEQGRFLQAGCCRRPHSTSPGHPLMDSPTAHRLLAVVMLEWVAGARLAQMASLVEVFHSPRFDSASRAHLPQPEMARLEGVHLAVEVSHCPRFDSANPARLCLPEMMQGLMHPAMLVHPPRFCSASPAHPFPRDRAAHFPPEWVRSLLAEVSRWPQSD